MESPPKRLDAFEEQSGEGSEVEVELWESGTW